MPAVKTRDYISTLPPMERIEPDEQIQIRLMALASLNDLPQDRETLFYYNVREIPPRAKEQNVMQIAMQSRLKLFWRPKAIELKEGDDSSAKSNDYPHRRRSDPE